MLKQNRFLQYLAITAVEGAAAFVLMIQAPSAEQHALLGGLSGQRLLLAGFNGILLLLLVGVIMRAWLQPAWLAQTCRGLDRNFCAPGQLLVAEFFLGSSVLLILLFTLISLVMGWGRILERVLPLAGWVFLACLHLFFVLWLRYRDTFDKPVSINTAFFQILNGSFLGKTRFWLGLAIILTAGLVLLPSTTIGSGRIPTHDSGIFLYFGKQILNGQVPFLDLWDHKPPLIFYIDAFGFLVSNNSLRGIWLMEFASLAAGAVLAFSFLQRFFSPWAAALGVAATLANIVFVLEGGNLTEEFALPLQWGTLFLAAFGMEVAWRGRRGAWTAFGIGLLFSLALSLKQTMIGIWVALGIYLALLAFMDQQKPMWRAFLWMAVGALAGGSAWVVYFAAHGALEDFWSVAYVYNFLYSDVTVARRSAMFAEMFSFLAGASAYFVLAMAAWVAGVAVIGFTCARGGYNRKAVARCLGSAPLGFPLAVVLIDILVEILLINTSGKNYRHYFLTLLPGCSVLVSWLVGELIARARNLPGLVRVAGGLLLAGLMFGASLLEMNHLLRPSTEATIQQTAKYVQEHTRAEDYVLMWGSQTTVNYLSDRQSPTRFVHQKPLFRQGYANASYSREILDDITTRAPQLIINTHLPSTPFIQLAEDGKCQYPPGPLPDGMDAVFDYICQHYELETVITKDQWEVLRYRP